MLEILAGLSLVMMVHLGTILFSEMLCHEAG